MNEIKVTYDTYIDFRYGELVLIQRKITEGHYDRPEVIDKIIGSILDIIA